MDRYPFQPELLDALPEELAELFRSLEDTLLEGICARLAEAGQLNEVTVQDIRALRAQGIAMDEITKAISTVTSTGEEMLSSLLEDVVAWNQAYYTELIDLAGVTQPEHIVDSEDITAIIQQTREEMSNITRSMGFLVDNGRTKLPPAKTYQWALDNAEMQIQSGAISYNQAISGAVKQLADSGLKTVAYESGHVDQVDVAVRRAVMTGTNQLCQQYATQAMTGLGTDLVEVSAHLGARNKDGPKGWENHEKWQGKIYRWKEKPKTSSGEYPDFEATCGYGDVTGIEGANCRHHFSPFVEGIMEPTYTQEQLEAMKGKNRAITFEDREYDGYEATQKQREIERTIRKLKREKLAYEAAGLNQDAQDVNIRIRRLTQKYKDFSKAAGLKEQTERMQVEYGDHGSARDKESEDSLVKLERYTDVTELWRETATPNSHTVLDLQKYTANGVTYKVDGHNVVLDYSPHEKEVAELLEREFGGEMYMVPRVNNPQGVSTPDYLFRGKDYDLKTIGKKAGKDTIFQRVQKAKRQSHNFIIDVSAADLDKKTIDQQIGKIFWSHSTTFVDYLIIIKDAKIIQVVKRT